MEVAKKANPVLWTARYLREAKEELEKVAWPSRRDAFRYTALVVGISVGLAVAIAGIDWSLARGLEALIGTVAK